MRKKYVDRLMEIRQWVCRFGKMTLDECVRIQRLGRYYCKALMRDVVAMWPDDFMLVNEALYLKRGFYEEYLALDDTQKQTKIDRGISGGELEE